MFPGKQQESKIVSQPQQKIQENSGRQKLLDFGVKQFPNNKSEEEKRTSWDTQNTGQEMFKATGTIPG